MLIAVVWVVGLRLFQRAGRGLPWHEQARPPDGQEQPRGHSPDDGAEGDRAGVEHGPRRVRFAVAAVATLAAGVVLERSGEPSPGIGLTGVLFGATVLAAATSLPEISTG